MFPPVDVSFVSGHSQSTTMQMFGDLTNKTIIIFDNIPALEYFDKDAIGKLRLFFERCKVQIVIFKLKMSWFGPRSTKFFGYKVSYGKHVMDFDRKNVIDV